MISGPALCLDVGSTWTKAALVGAGGELLGTAQHRTTVPEVLTGIDAVTAQLGGAGGSSGAIPVLACSSAGGGLRLAVVGQEPLVSAEAGRRVALSAGARVVHVHAGDLDGPGLRKLRAAVPDVLLLVGGTDGGDARTLLHNAARLAANRIRPPIVLAGNAEAAADALALLRSTNRSVVLAGNVLPDVGELNPRPARQAIREVFLRHVIGGKGLSRGSRFRQLVRAVTPDAVLAGVSRLAALRSAAVLVVDVGGATTDVYSVAPVPAAAAHAVGEAGEQRTVEGDLGMRISAPGLVSEATLAERLVTADAALALEAAARLRATEPGHVPAGPPDAEIDLRLATFAATIAVRRHLRLAPGRFGTSGADLLVLSGGVFRHAAAAGLAQVYATLRADPALRPVLRRAQAVTDIDYVLAAAGLLAGADRPQAADALLGRLVAGP